MSALRVAILAAAAAGLGWGQSPLISLTTTPNPSTFGQSVTMNAQTSGIGSNQTIRFVEVVNSADVLLGTAATDSGGFATFSTSSLAVGTHRVQAIYVVGPVGDQSIFRSNTVLQVVNKATPTVTVVSSPNPSNAGQTISITATLSSSAATGTVQFFSDGVQLTGGPTPLVNGTATIQTSTLTVGTHDLSAVYSGDSNFNSTSGRTQHVVNRTATTLTLTSSLNPSNVGQTVTFTATLSATAATGTITFFLDGSSIIATRDLVNSNTANVQVSNLTAGNHSITATFNGNPDLQGSTATITQVVRTATQTTLDVSPNPANVGQTVTLVATVTPSGATGTVTFFDGSTNIGSIGLQSNGTATLQVSTFTAGQHTLTATYNGDTIRGASTSAPVVLVVGQTALTLAATPNPATFGQTVTITATATGGATGTVIFRDGSTQIGSAALSNGTASITTSTLAVGTHPLTATLSSLTSNTVNLVINKAASTTTLTASASAVQPGQPVTLTATVGPSGVTGTVTFVEGATTLGTVNLTNGTASLTTGGLTAGTHTYSATYSGDNTFNSSTSGPVTVSANTVSLLLAANPPSPATLGQAVTLTATATPSTTTGTVTFVDGGTAIGTAALSNGVASITVTNFTLGTHQLTATLGNVTSNTLAYVVGKANSTVTLAPSATTIQPGQPVTFTATVSPTAATGTVTFSDGATTLGTSPVTNGVATLTTSSLAVGAHSVVAGYSGDNNFNGSTSNAVTVTVGTTVTPTITTLTVTPNPAAPGQLVTLVASVQPSNATGTVTFRDQGVAIGTQTLVGGTATLTTSSLSGGSHILTATYNGDTAFAPSTSAPVGTSITTPTVSVSLSASPTTANFGQPVTLNVLVSPTTATGGVSFTDSVSGQVGTATLSAGSASITLNNLKVGTHVLQAFYSGDARVPSGESNTVTVTINPTPTTTTLSGPATANAGVSITFTAAVAPAGASGSVSFREGGTTLGTGTLSGGTASFSTALDAGTHTIVAVYAGDGTFGPSTSNTVTVNVIARVSSTTSLSASPTLATPGQTVTLTATVAPSTATGTVTFSDGSTVLGSSSLSGGTASVTTSGLSVGAHSVVATYAGDEKTAPSSSSAVTVTVQDRTATTTTLSVSPNPAVQGQTVTLTATVAPATAAGTVTFSDGGTVLGTASLGNGSASITTTLTAGSHSLTAAYGGSATHTPSTSAGVTITVTPAPPIQITGPASLPGGFVGTAYSQAFTATGGTGTLTWSLAGGSVAGLNLSPGGTLSGTPTAIGNSTLTVRVQDTVGQAAAGVFTLVVNPALPTVTLNVTQPASITDVPVTSTNLLNYPVGLNGTYRLTFTPNAAGLPANFNNTAVQFVTGGTTANVSIPAGATAAVNLPGVQLGSVAGTITVQLASLTVASTGQAVPLPSPVPSVNIAVPRLAPVITPGSVRIINITSTGFQVVLNALSTPRDLTSAAVTFTAAAGTQLNGTSFTIPLTAAAATWFDAGNATSAANGGAFSLTLPFTYSGDTNALNTVSVTLTNSVGTSPAVSGGK